MRQSQALGIEVDSPSVCRCR